MKRLAVAILALSFCAAAIAGKEHPRPKILGIASAHFYTTDNPGARKFYSIIFAKDLSCTMCEEHAFEALVIRLPSQQVVTFSAPAGPTPSNLLAEVVFATDDADAMRAYLKAQKIKIEKGPDPGVPSPRTHPDSPSDPTIAAVATFADFSILDPEGHRIGFVQVEKGWSPSNTDALRLIHAGFVVNDRTAEDRFYKDILGFHLYWHGGMKDDKNDWVAMQVPDGTDWIEYMLNISPTASKHTLGVMNHMALGVTDIHETEKRLIADGWKPTEEPKVGRDGKWQLNLYDPDETRTEFMEFAPKEKPCCSEITGPNPGPQK
jgi:catechol 2,3-dioxygenase-like lactoylglutathione lyase family enzyme